MTEDLKTAPSVDLQRYLGTWYEIARKPMRHEDETASNITADYSLNEDGSVRVLNSCINEEGEPEQSEGQAKPVDGSNARLEVTFLPQGLRWIPFTRGDYWIMRLDESYQTALVGDPQRKFLWLLHRRPQLDADTRAEWLGFAQAQGYDIGDIIVPVQNGQA
jgi:apolipoprotein D and lipocalin family protein